MSTSTSTRVSIEDIDPEHRSAFSKAVQRVLSTALALETYAQVIDGVPLCDVAWDRYQHRLHETHPINYHEELCPGALEAAKSMRDELDLGSLSFEAKLLQSYQSSKPLSRGFQLRLLELVAVTLHQTAVNLFQKGTCLHDQHNPTGSNLSSENITNWQRPYSRWFATHPLPTLFTHPGFTAREQYPNGVADMVGYWAEDRILGGVTLFDRSNDWENGDDEPNVYFQSSRPKRTYMVYQLTDGQQKELLDYLLCLSADSQSKDGKSPPCPLPLSGSREHKIQIHPEFAVSTHRIYRDIWERPAPRPFRRRRQRDVVDPYENPGAADEELKRLKEIAPF